MSDETAAQADELTSLLTATEALTNEIGAESDTLTVEAAAVLDRLRNRRFDVAVVGEFNRGKSTLLNMLTDRMVLPAGILPVTAAVTELTYGDGENATVRYTDGTDEVIDLNQLEAYVTEEANPGNKRNVENVSINLPSPVLRHGAVLVDTPGVGSIFRHNSDTARTVIEHADAAIVVLSADTPITDAERSLIKALSKRSQKTFFVLNRIDHLEQPEREKVAWFVENVLHEAFGSPQKLWPLSAKTREGFEEFAGAVDSFLSTELDSARARLARKDVAALADMVDNECSLEESALEHSAGEIEDKLTAFRRAIAHQSEAFSDDTVLFEHATHRIRESLAERLSSVGVDDEAHDRLRNATREVPTGELADAIRRAVEAEVHTTIEPVRRREELEVERSWSRAAERYERATQRRATKMRETASDLFSVDLKPIERVQPANHRGRFFYSPPEMGADAGVSFGTRIAALFSPARRREQMLETAHHRYTEEVRRHLQRLRDDLSARITDANESLETAMGEQVSTLGDAMASAVERGQARRHTTEQEQKRLAERSARLHAAADRARTTATEEDENTVSV